LRHAQIFVFPANPEAPKDPDAQGAEVLRASLARVVATGLPDTMALQRYDVQATGVPRVFEERYWSAVNTPVLGPGGEVKLIIHRAEEVTGLLQHLRRDLLPEPGRRASRLHGGGLARGMMFAVSQVVKVSATVRTGVGERG
jgi:hypothetical protein